VGTGNRFQIERVRDLDTAWQDLTPLFLEFEAYHQAFQPRELVPEWQERLQQRLRLHDDRLVLLARARGQAIGCLMGVIRRDDGLAFDTYGYLTYAFVRESSRSMGAGRKLLQEAEAWCRERGASRVELDVFAENDLGVGFWTRSGFTTLSLTMTKPLERAS
jgi:GNAT superfamily N-acetyltransferase